ncbi:hypothetical protein AC792_06565 [Arthrobacter sp. RIT-PI-e]|nr:hypothetical protein AC792_06565 [Arthrobacter sp. RIT-PI-e]
MVLERGPLVCARWSPEIVMQAQDADLLIGSIRATLPGHRVHLLMFLNGMASLDQQALARFASGAPLSAVGLVGPSILDRALIELYVELYRPAFPVGYFETEGPARSWLAEQVHESRTH